MNVKIMKPYGFCAGVEYVLRMIQQIIEDGLNDMARVGILTVDGDGNYSAEMLANPQIIGCVQLYARYMVNYGGEADRYLKNYCHKRDALSLHGGYYAE